MANYKYETNKCDGGEGMNWCVIRHEFNESGGSVGTVVRYAHTRDIARAYVSASKVADAIPGATIRTTMTEGKTTFRVWPPAVHIEAPALVQPSYYISKSIGQADIVEIRGPFEVSVASFSTYEAAFDAFCRVGQPGRVGGPSLPFSPPLKPRTGMTGAPMRLSDLAPLGRPYDQWHTSYTQELTRM